MSDHQPEGASQRGLRLPGWRILVVMWGLLALAGVAVTLWAEWNADRQAIPPAAEARSAEVTPASPHGHDAAPTEPVEARAEANLALADATDPATPAAPGDAALTPPLPIPASATGAAPVIVPADPPPTGSIAAVPALSPPPAGPIAATGPEASPGPVAPPVEAAPGHLAEPPPTAPPVMALEPPRPPSPPVAAPPVVATITSPAVTAPQGAPVPETVGAESTIARPEAAVPVATPDQPPPVGAQSPEAVPVVAPVIAALPASPPPDPPQQGLFVPSLVPGAMAAPPSMPVPPSAPPTPGAVTATLPPVLPEATPPGPAARQLAVIRPTPPTPGGIPAPELALLEPSRHGFLPRRGADGRLPYQVYAQPFRRIDNRPRIAVIVSDSGSSSIQSEDAIRRLPPQIAIAISPYAAQPEVLAARARERGMETLVALPLEPAGYPFNDPGPRALLTSRTAAQNTDSLEWALGRFAGYVGAVGAIGSMRGERFAQMPDQMRRMHDTLRERGLLYIDPRAGTTTTDRVWGRTVDIVLDDPPTRNEIERRISELETSARLRGSALGFAGHLTPVLLDRLVSWAVGMEARGLTLAPVSSVLRVRQPVETGPFLDPTAVNR